MFHESSIRPRIRTLNKNQKQENVALTSDRVVGMKVLVKYFDCVLPEQVGQLLDSSTPEQVGQRVEVPDVELVVQRAAEAHTNEVRGEHNQYNL